MTDVTLSHRGDQIAGNLRNCAGTSRTMGRRYNRFRMQRSHFERLPPLESLEGLEHHRTQGIISEICIPYLRDRCQWDSLCHRIHPVDKSPFLKLLHESSINRSDIHSPTPAITIGDVRTLERVGSPSISDSCVPVIKLPGTTLTKCQTQSTDCSRVNDSDHRSSSRDYRSWVHRTLSRSSTSAGQDGAFESTLPSRSPTWNPETGDWGEIRAQDWLDDASSRTPLSEFSMHPFADSDARNEMRRSPPNQYLEKCEAWLDTVQKRNRRRRPPGYPERCRNWLRNVCPKGYECRYVHDDLEYESEDEHDGQLQPATVRGFKRRSIILHDHIKVDFVAGFEIENIITGFETSYVNLRGIPNHIEPGQVLEFLRPFYNVQDILMSKSLQPTKSARITFSKPEDARAALASLKQIPAFGSRISAGLPPITATFRDAVFRDGTVIVEWEPPGKTWYAGYKGIADAQKAISQAQALACDCPIEAQIHTGLPAAGPVTVRFRGLPSHFDEQDLQRFGSPTCVLWKRAKYMNLSRVTSMIKSILEKYGNLLSFDVDPASGKPYKMKASARFSSATAADEACRSLHGSSPSFTGRTKIYANHDRCIEYRFSSELYAKVSSAIGVLQCYVWDRFGHDASVIVSGYNPVVIKLHARALKILGKIKLEFEKTISGDVVKHDGKVVWDDYFAFPLGIQYIQSLQVRYSGIKICIEPRRRIRLFGTLHKREVVHRLIVEKVSELRARQCSFIPLNGLFIGAFVSKELLVLQRTLGPESVALDVCNLGLKIYGGNVIHRRAFDLVHQVYARYGTGQRPNDYFCPVCLDKPSNSILLKCGHLWCRACLSGYLRAGMSNASFPLYCLGNGATCEWRVPLLVAEDLLPAEEFQSLVEASLTAYVESHSDEFHYCPSPDCPQVYRAAPKGTVIQCPSCLLRICPACHQEAHEGFSCADDDEWDKDFREWAKDHDAKRCPGCRITIERVEGCNHVACTRCQTHICWVCMETFPKGEGIYGHMRTVHGDFGLGPII